MYRDDDSIISANTPFTSGYEEEQRDYSIYRCIITEVQYTDEDSNITKDSLNPQVTYSAMVIGGYNEGLIFTELRAVRSLAGNNNYSETIYKPSTKTLGEIESQDSDGDAVYVAFIGGLKHAGIILGGANQPLDSSQTGAVKEDGPRKIEQYNGILTKIDKNGFWSLTRLGGSYDAESGEFKPDSNGKSVIIKYEEDLISRSVKDSTITEEFSGVAEKITRTFKSGLKIEEDGSSDSVTITMSGGAKVQVNGDNIEINSGSAKILIDSSGKITLSGDKVDLGSATSDFVPLFTELLTAFNQHTHMVPQAPEGVLPSQPPTAPMLSTVGSASVKVQS